MYSCIHTFCTSYSSYYGASQSSGPKTIFVEQKKSPYILKKLEKIAQYTNKERSKNKVKRTQYFQKGHLGKITSILNSQNKISLLSK